MAHKKSGESDFTPVRLEIDEDSNNAFKRWAQAEGIPSKRRFMAIQLRRLADLRKSNPTGLKAIGLMS